MSQAPKHWTNSGAGLAVGVVVLVIVTAILAAAFSAVSANRQVGHLTTQLVHQNDQLAALRSNNADAEARSSKAAGERADLMAQNQTLQRQVDALIHYLRSHGIEVPDPRPRTLIPSPPTASPSHSPRPRKPAVRPPTNPAPSPPINLCALVSVLCPMTSSKVVLYGPDSVAYGAAAPGPVLVGRLAASDSQGWHEGPSWRFALHRLEPAAHSGRGRGHALGHGPKGRMALHRPHGRQAPTNDPG